MFLNYKRQLAVTIFGLFASVAQAKPAWNPDNLALHWKANEHVIVQNLDCEAQGYSGLVVEGPITLIHPKPSEASFQTISIRCPYIVFNDGGQLSSKERLEIKARVQISGPVRILSTRGENGHAPLDNPAIWDVVKSPDGAPGTDGASGRNAETDLKGDWDSEAGGAGKVGLGGANGLEGASGAPAGGGKSASPIILWVGDFADNTSVTIHAIGGDGVKGGKGGRGQDGGKGGQGGTGGNGGNGNTVHTGSSGGNGGNGGDGGRGGNGGQGGAGGNGGNGGDILVEIKVGAMAPTDYDLSAAGGNPGEGGEGGDPGIGGDGGNGGPPGCGGSGGKFIGIRVNDNGSCGTNGQQGLKGADGKKGPPGAFGVEGAAGDIAKLRVREEVPASEF